MVNHKCTLTLNIAHLGGHARHKWFAMPNNVQPTLLLQIFSENAPVKRRNMKEAIRVSNELHQVYAYTHTYIYTHTLTHTYIYTYIYIYIYRERERERERETSCRFALYRG